MTLFGCPNSPPCPHGSFVHDIEDYGDPVPRCCAEGCGCGQRERQYCGCLVACDIVVRECGEHFVQLRWRLDEIRNVMDSGPPATVGADHYSREGPGHAG